MKTFSIIIVDYFKAKRLIKVVDSIFAKNQKQFFEIIVIDNSVDKENKEILTSLAEQYSITLCFNEENVGYTKACNEGAKIAGGKYLLFLNPDIIFEIEDTLQQISDYLSENQDIAILGIKQMNDDGSIADVARSFPNFVAQIGRRTFLRYIPWLKKTVLSYELSDFDYDKTQTVPWLQSSFMVVPSDLFFQMKMFDERFFLFMADTDLCCDAWALNKKVMYYSEVYVRADGIRCSSGGLKELFTKKTLRIHLVDSIKFYLKYLFKACVYSKSSS